MGENLAPPSAESVLSFDLLAASPLAWVALILGALYLRGAIALWARGRRWSIARTVAFLLGCTLLFLVTALGVDRYADTLVSALVFQQITIMTVVPPLLIVGSPGRLLLRSTPHTGIGRLTLRLAHAGLRSRLARTVLHPVVPIIVAIAMFPGLYLTDLVSPVIRMPAGHDLLLGVFFLSGVVAATPLWSTDPLPRAPSFVVRLVDVFLEIQIHAVFGLVLLMTGTALFAAYASAPWGIPATTDQSIAGTLAWTYGELPLLLVLIVTLSRWRSRDIRHAARHQEQADVDLDAYNDYLAQLQRRMPDPS